MISLLPRLACPLLDTMVRHRQIMNSIKYSRLHLSVGRLVCALACFFPTLLLAHPGHHHPDEVDEFDFLRATFLHSHGAMDYLIAAVVLASLAVVCLHGQPRIRITAMIVALGSLALLPIL